MGISVPANATTLDRIRQIHGSAVANELIEFKVSSPRWGFTADGRISNANYSVKKTTFLLFINHRSVDSSPIKKALEQTYAAFLPKGGHPFIYLSLEIEPQRVDVNVHPTKREVNFLHEDEIIEFICDEVRATLGKVDTSRTFMTQTLLPNARISLSKSATPTPTRDTPISDGGDPGRATVKKTPRPYDNDLVRTDSRVRKITAMLPPGALAAEDNMAQEQANDMDYEYTDKEQTLCRLKSIKELRADVRDNMHNELTDIFATHTFIGIVDGTRRIVAMQGGVKLYLVDYGMVCNEYFYQLGLTDFGNFGSIRFNPPLDLTALLAVAAAQERELAQAPPDMNWDDVVEAVRNKIIDRRDMLSECFSLDISEDGSVEGIPLLVKGYMPPLTKLPQFLLRLGPFVNWDEEKPCFHSFLRELASFYVPEALPIPPANAVEDEKIAARRRHLVRGIENVIFPAFKARLVATKGLLKGIVEIANLKGLYRVFERC
jgi:DNA mismatch repair protein MLH1